MTDADRGDDSSLATPTELADPSGLEHAAHVDRRHRDLERQQDGDGAGAVRRGWATFRHGMRWLLGAVTLVGGLTWILLNLSGPSAPLDTVVGCVLAAGGLVLLMPHRIRLPRTATAVTMSTTALVGTLAGLFAASERRGTYAYVTELGWPFPWVLRGAVADDADTAYRLAQGSPWHVDLVALAGNGLVFAYAGMLAVVIAGLIRSRRS